MNADLFTLRPPRPLQLPDTLLDKPIARLRALTAALPDGTAAIGADLLDHLRAAMRAGMRRGLSFEEATNVRRRESLLVTLYTLDLALPDARAWLPPFDETVARSVLGDSPTRWHPARRRDVTQLFFTQFDRIAALPLVASMLRVAWENARDGVFDESALVWGRNAEMLFAENGPERLAKVWLSGESADALAERFHVHEGSRFRERLLQTVLLGRLARLPFGKEDAALFSALEQSKLSPAGASRPLGSHAVEILVRRATEERVASWPRPWSQALVTLSCDPRLPNVAERQRWWGWATERQRDVAIKALTSLTIEEFIKLLDRSLRGTPAEHQFQRRRDFLLKLFEHGHVTEARLVVHETLYAALDPRTRSGLMLSRVSGGAQHTSMICLRCTDDLFLIEGTHNFGLRGFVGEARFPIRGFWSAAPRRFDDHQLRAPEATCDIFQRHHVGDWVGDFFRFHAVPWPRFFL